MPAGYVRSRRRRREADSTEAILRRQIFRGEFLPLRLKDLRRVATRYDKLARNHFSTLCLVAAIVFGLLQIESGGLAIVTEITKAQHRGISVDDNPGGDIVFTLRFGQLMG
jgi:hypothetical protein